MPTCTEADYLLHNYHFDLPQESIAQSPSSERENSRLLCLDRESGSLSTGLFRDITHLLPERCLLIANNSRVIPARIKGMRKDGGKVEFLLLTPIPLLKPQHCEANPLFPNWNKAEAEMLIRPAKKVRIGEIISIGLDFAIEILEKGPYGRCTVHLVWQGDLLSVLERCGQTPLPPYIRRNNPDVAVSPLTPEADAGRYQTVYAAQDKPGSVAAPTAGLHFTQGLKEALLASGREWAEVTLYVGYGTFSPVREEDIRNHQMHAEYAELPAATAEAVNRAKAEGRAVIAVGTTSCRVLEGMYELQHDAQAQAAACQDAPPPGALPSVGLAAREAWLKTFLYPGRPFHVIDGLITNFHLPESSLLMLVSAFAGRERILAAYHRAIEDRFRFFSYGDAMLIL